MMLNAQQLNEIRQRLDNRYNALLAEIHAGRSKAGMLVGGDEGGIASRDRVADLQAADIAHAELGRDWHELAEIQRARERLDSGDYGTCIECSRAIPAQRLMTSPESLRCVDCQQSFERGAGQSRRHA